MDLTESDALAVELLRAIHDGDQSSLRRLIDVNPELGTATIVRAPADDPRAFAYPVLAAATDWPGSFPRVGDTIRLLIAAGADPNERCRGAHNETPVHWAASCDDVEALDALLDAGADIEAAGAVIGGGTPLADAVAFGQWNAARRLIERGAQSNLWQSAAMGLMNRVESAFAGAAPPLDEITGAFWCACHGGQRGAAEYLFTRGADPSWIGWERLTALGAAERSGHHDLANWLRRITSV